MADLASGFWPVHGLHAQRSMDAVRREVASGYATGIFLGDPVAQSGDASWIVAGTSTLVSGVSNGASYVLAGKRVSDKFLPASTTYTPTARGSQNASFIYAFIDPGIIFECVFSAALTSDYYTYVGNNANGLGGTSGSTTTGISGYQIDIASLTTGTGQWRVYYLDDRTADEDVSTSTVKGFFQINAAIAGANPYLTSSGV